MQTLHPRKPTRRWAGLGPAAWAFLAVLALLPLTLFQFYRSHGEHEALRAANSIGAVISTVRSYYQRNIVGPVQAASGRVVVTENHHAMPGAIPIPATFSIELGEAIAQEHRDREFAFQFLSDWPFLNRKRPVLGGFEADALRALREPEIAGGGPSGDGPSFWRVEPLTPGGPPYLRLAFPVRMEAGCVACHNTHPDSPVRTWKVGDVRGIQVVSVAVDGTGNTADNILLGLYLALLGLTGSLAFRDYKAGADQLQRVNAQLRASQQGLEEKSRVLEQSVRELRTKTTVLERAPFGVVVMDPTAHDRPVQSVNEAFSALTGYPPEAVQGRHLRFLFGPDTDRASARALDAALQAHRPYEGEFSIQTRSGASRLIRWLVFPSLGDQGERLSMVACLTDVTEVREAQRESQRLAGELQESTKLRSLGLTIAGMAHDLNTPIGIAITAASSLDRSTADLRRALTRQPPDAEAATAQLARIERSAVLVRNNLGRAAQLVQGFKQTSADATRTEWQAVNLRGLLDSLLVTLSPVLRRAQCQAHLVCPADVTVHTEPGSVAQAITNLLVNATLHAFEGRDDRQITITVEPADTEVLIRVADNGNGMSEAAVVNAFTPFFTTRRASGGSGLGLFSSRRVIEQVLGGRITLESRPGAGTTFHIHLPRQRATPVASA